MRTLLAAVVVILGLMLPATPASAKKNRSDVSKKSNVNDGDGFTRGKKRKADDPVLRRYGKKATYVAVANYGSNQSNDDVVKPSKKSKAKPAKVAKEEVVVIEETPSKKPAKKAKPMKQASEEVLIIEEEPTKKPAKKKKPAKADDDDGVVIIEE